MVMNARDIQNGMDVFGSDGEKIGTVKDVYSDAGAGVRGYDMGSRATDMTGDAGDIVSQQVPPAGTTRYGSSGAGMNAPHTSVDFGAAGAGPAGYGATGSTAGVAETGGGTTTIGAGSMTMGGYFKVESGGVLGIGAQELYIPFSAVSDTVPGDNVTVNCTKDDCTNRFSHKPDSVGDNGDPGSLT